MLAQIIGNGRVGPTIFNMTWSRIDLRKSKVSLRRRPLSLSTLAPPSGLHKSANAAAKSVKSLR
jgi:hypothetical protein